MGSRDRCIWSGAKAIRTRRPAPRCRHALPDSTEAMTHRGRALGPLPARLDGSETFSEEKQTFSSLSVSSHVIPTDVVPADVIPADVVPADVVPADVVPADVVPTDVVPTDVIPTDVVP